MIDSYPILFYTLIGQSSLYGLFLVFYVNNKIQAIDKSNNLDLRRSKHADHDKMIHRTKIKKQELTSKSKKTMLVILVVSILVNTIYISILSKLEFMLIVWAYIVPILSYYVFVVALLIAMGLKGAHILRTGRFLKGLE